MLVATEFGEFINLTPKSHLFAQRIKGVVYVKAALPKSGQDFMIDEFHTMEEAQRLMENIVKALTEDYKIYRP